MNIAQYDPIAIAERKFEIAKLMQRVDAKREELARKIAADEVDLAEAIQLNARMPGYLGELWEEFLALPKDEQVGALATTEFKGMAWQSLLQCSPYFRQT